MFIIPCKHKRIDCVIQIVEGSRWIDCTCSGKDQYLMSMDMVKSRVDEGDDMHILEVCLVSWTTSTTTGLKLASRPDMQ